MKAVSMLLAAALWLPYSTAPASAQAYPSKPIRMIVPTAPSGPTDFLARVAADYLVKALGQPVVVENIPGAGGNVALHAAAKSAPDGYTLVLASQGTIALGPFLFQNLPFDYDKDFAPVMLLAAPPYVLVVTPTVPANNLEELLGLLRSKPGAFNFASTNGNGSSSHVAGELFKKMGKVDVVHVPFKGDALAQSAVMGGHVQMVFTLTAGAAPNIRGGRLKAIAIGSPRRSAALPDVPTFEESGMPGFRAASWFAFLTRAGSPAAIISRLNDELNRMLQQPEARAKLLSVGAEPAGGSVSDLAEHLRSERAKWGQVIREANIKLD